ncbi:glutamine-synthetase adenylyltransferase [Ruegeria pomeroyi]|uniref:Glutamate-ammonia ligase adenylyltransferase n=2 Tax=Ruegeria pomeroyi TaxID=89184 RepID=Q5LQG7_RUEPO|nr:glutamine-synthetase adenylyltransferase [Ruegeria pomeroyi]AAV95773.1 glutamate-ammonia ligase adenylyltransferase [Ruegeria pomeroyi DSS-3]NVK98903.1 glutamine-synthetase adenylyltransferase [Ruegeria pomeroyi]NVL03115.1 glutamine-synthetase adenylyltransferase [Ruegeria pomeroyi]QWV09353.1 glutamine-synthetase adenylyltransferase [Ruegeria pomeroyi]
MSTRLAITRLPRAYDPDLGAEARALLPDLGGDLADLVAGTGGTSPYLMGLMRAEAAWLAPALNDADAAVAAELAAARALPPDQLKPGLRRAKRRLALLTALADLAGAWPLEKVTALLTDFGALAADLAAKAEIAALIRRGKLPGQTEADVETAAGMVILAMGKMGAHELNYSSDIDLIVLFDETRYDPDDFFEARQGMVRATRNFCATLSDKTADGYVFRTDLRLRPDPAVTPVCLAMEAAEHYYESLGRTWERAAYIKARPCAGDLAAGARFLETLRPFVWRRHLDFAAIQDAHDMRLRIRENKGTGGALTIAGHDMKLGRGGIREIEFFTQTRQLIAGGRDRDLRLRGTVEGLAALAAKGWVPSEVAEALTRHYRAHREVEHRIQMVHDAQTHRIPQTEEGIARVACLMGIDATELRADLTRRLTEVHGLTEDFFAPDTGAAPAPAMPAEVVFDDNVLSRWPTYPALRSQRGRRIFERLKPELLARLARTAKPDEALLALDGFLAGLPAGVQLFSLFEANPQLIDLLVDIVGTSHTLATFLSRNASVFDAVIGGSFFDDWPGGAALRADLAERLAAEDDYETRLDMARRWTKEWHFRIGVHHLRGLIDGARAGAQYAELAEAVISALFPVVEAQFARKHGNPPGRGATVLGMGSLGAGRINAQSDLDLIVIYDPEDAEGSDGPRPLATRPYYARLTQALITALTAPMSQGRLYEVDMRLRPSGTQGPVATSWTSFTEYQLNEAWVWEHLALTRARPVAGSVALGEDIERFRQELLNRPADRDKVLREVGEMRARLAAAKQPAGVWDAKTGPGRMLDIELVAQTGALLSGSAARDVAQGLQGAVAAGWLNVADAQSLTRAYDLCWSVQTAARLLSGEMIDAERIGEGGAAFLCRSTGFQDMASLQAALETTYAEAAALIGAAVGGTEDAEDG